MQSLDDKKMSEGKMSEDRELPTVGIPGDCICNSPQRHLLLFCGELETVVYAILDCNLRVVFVVAWIVIVESVRLFLTRLFLSMGNGSQ